MSIVTHQDVIDYMNTIYDRSCYEVQGSKLVINCLVYFDHFTFNTLPLELVFDGGCILGRSKIESVPEDIVLNGSLFLRGSKITTLPVLDIGGRLDIRDTDIVLKDGTYVGGMVFSEGSNYEYVDELIINGYLFSTGVLS